MLSASDERAVVLRNGIEIGSTPIAIRGRISGLQAFTLSSIDQHGTHWMYLPLLGSARAGEVSRQERERLTLPEEFRSEEHTSELQSLMRISYAVFCLKKKNTPSPNTDDQHITNTNH